ncbi:hypothetical protein CYMTET_53427 [Cymbomonas tetramitiformis]|uniref:Uncharacterized protein n=1 Tax=Cymbomonas tetramitiformis TaxID=36881 RepID=A0AAE0BGX9_9CHLO|nr:hypothetical protein CYMTET_53427 [Cymbomonas tetramitiformis]
MPADPACQEHIAAGQAALCMGEPLVGPFVPIYPENRVDLKVRMNLTTYSLLYDEEEGFTEAYQELLTGMTAKMREEFDLTVTASALAVVLHAVETDPDNPDTAVLIDFSVVLPDVGTEESERFRDAFDNNFTDMMGNVIESFPMMLLSSSNQHGYPRTHAPTTYAPTTVFATAAASESAYAALAPAATPAATPASASAAAASAVAALTPSALAAALASAPTTAALAAGHAPPALSTIQRTDHGRSDDHLDARTDPDAHIRRVGHDGLGVGDHRLAAAASARHDAAVE